MFKKKSSDSEWQSFILNLNNSNEFIVSMESTVIQNDTLYDFTIGAVDLGDISNFNPFSARRLYVTSTPQDHTGNIIGQLRSNYGTDIPVPISDVSGVLETYPSSDGKTYAFENIYNGTYAITVDAPYFDPLFTRVSVPIQGVCRNELIKPSYRRYDSSNNFSIAGSNGVYDQSKYGFACGNSF